MLDKMGNVIYFEVQNNYPVFNSNEQINPICDVCGQPIIHGDVVAQQGGPHLRCFKREPLVVILKELEEQGK